MPSIFPRSPVRFALAAGALLVATAFLLLQHVPAHAATLAAPAAIPLNSSSCPTDIREGQMSGCVTTLQRDLNKDDRAGLTVDGDFGPATLAALKTYQSRHGLSVDGVAGPQTKASLLRGGSTPPPSSSGGVKDYPGTGLSTNYDWARLVLKDGGWPQSSNNVKVITQWMGSENPPSTWWRGNDNPLDNGLGSGGGAGLGSYPNLHTAAYYVALNLASGKYGYAAIVSDFKASAAPSTTARAIWNSSWAGSHYGYGADWYSATAPKVATPRGVAW